MLSDVLWRFGPLFLHKKNKNEQVRDYILRRLPHGAVAAEIGVRRGDFSAKTLRIAEPRRLHLIDPWIADPHDQHRERPGNTVPVLTYADPEGDYQSVLKRFAAEISAGVVQTHRQFSADAVTSFEDNYFDWVYVDGNHEYEYVKADLELYYPKLKPGGLFLCNDYNFSLYWGDGVNRAVDEFVAKGFCTKVYQRRFEYVMRKPRAPRAQAA